MAFWTADTDIIRKYFETGLVDGVTTNPTLIMKLVGTLKMSMKIFVTSELKISAWK